MYRKYQLEIELNSAENSTLFMKLFNNVLE